MHYIYTILFNCNICNSVSIAMYGCIFSTYLNLILTLTLKIVYLDTTYILHLNYYVQHIGNKKIIIYVVPRRPYKNIWMSISHDHLKEIIPVLFVT